MSLAPCSPLMFKGVDFYLFGVYINEYNCIGLFLAFCFLVLFVVFYFGASNLTLEPEYQLVKDDILSEKDKVAEEEKSNGTGHKLLTTKDIFTNFDLVLLLTSRGILLFQYFGIEMLINITVLYHFHWTMTNIAIVTAVCVVIASILLFFGQNYIMAKSTNVYLLYITCFLILATVESLLNLAVQLEIENMILQIIVVSIVLFLNLFQGFGSTVYSRYLLFSLTPSHSASIMESHRYIVSHLFGFFGCFTSSFVFDSMFYCFLLMNVTCYIIVSLLLIRRPHILGNSKYDM